MILPWENHLSLVKQMYKTLNDRFIVLKIGNIYIYINVIEVIYFCHWFIKHIFEEMFLEI